MQIEAGSDEHGGFLIVTDHRGGIFKIDSADQPFLDIGRWRVFSSRGCWYVVCSHQGKSLLLHRAIMDAPKGLTVDHRDGDGLNDRRHNMRLCTWLDNQRNYHCPRRSPSGYRGVYQTASGRYQVIISVNKFTRHYGTFDDPIEAAKARDVVVLREFGAEFAQLNFPMCS